MVEDRGEAFFVVTAAGSDRKYKTLAAALRAVSKGKGPVLLKKVQGKDSRVILWTERA